MHEAGNNNETKITNGGDAPLWNPFCFTSIQKFLLLEKVKPIDDKVRIACVLQTVESHVQVVMSSVAISRNGSPFEGSGVPWSEVHCEGPLVAWATT